MYADSTKFYRYKKRLQHFDGGDGDSRTKQGLENSQLGLRDGDGDLPSGHLESKVWVAFTPQHDICTSGDAPLFLSFRDRLHPQVTLP